MQTQNDTVFTDLLAREPLPDDRADLIQAALHLADLFQAYDLAESHEESQEVAARLLAIAVAAGDPPTQARLLVEAEEKATFSWDLMHTEKRQREPEPSWHQRDAQDALGFLGCAFAFLNLGAFEEVDEAYEEIYEIVTGLEKAFLPTASVPDPLPNLFGRHIA